MFSEPARRAIYYTNDIVLGGGESYVATEHLLLGVLQEPFDFACVILKNLGVNRKRVRVEIEKRLLTAPQPDSKEVSLTPRAKRVLDYAYHESQKLGDSFIGTEHLLLGLIREEEGLAIDLSYTEARLLGDGFIGTEHVLPRADSRG